MKIECINLNIIFTSTHIVGNGNKFEIEVFNDFNMKSCTDYLLKLGLCFNLGDDLYIPTVGQLAAMYLCMGYVDEGVAHELGEGGISSALGYGFKEHEVGL